MQQTTHQLWVEGRQITPSVTKLSPTTLRISWNIPTNPQVYAGAIVLLSEEPFATVNFPEDGKRYTPSTNWVAPADTIDHAKVVAAFYQFFGDDVSQTFVDVSNVDPNKLYYASIHAASSVLQYYTIGTQSYPLESSRLERKSETYAGSIPTAVVPPNDPYEGQAYYDSNENVVFIWNDQMAAWVKSNQKTIPTGIVPPIQQNQLFFNRIDQTLKFFNGTQWIPCSAANTRVKMGPTWSPFNSVSVKSFYPTDPIPTVGDFVFVTLKAQLSAPPSAELKFFSLSSWYSPTPALVQVFDGVNWNPITIGLDLYGSTDPYTPAIGDFFYQTSTRDLMIWTGTTWVKADTENEGAPSTDKIGIGTDGSYDERLRLINVLKHQVGYPQVCVELSEEQFNVAIDNALDEFRRRADNAYQLRYISFTIKRGQNMYYLNDPRDHTDKIVNVLKIHRINQLGISSLSAETGLYAQAFFNQLYQGSNVDVLSIHLMHQLSETFEKIFAGNISFIWDEPSRQMTILRRTMREEERVILEVVMERTEQELLLDRWAKQWLQGWAQAEIWEMLGEIRSKYGNLPGANGGITLNGDSLLARAEAQMNELLRQITDYEVGNGGVTFGNTAFMIG